MSILKTTALAAGLSLMGGIASAASWTTGDACSVDDVGPSADACWGFAVSPANAQNVDVNSDTFDGITGLFGETDWVVFQSAPSVSSDTVDVQDNDYEEVVALMKVGNTFAAYFFGDGFEGDLEFFQRPSLDLSNYVVAGRVSEVPLPASALLLLGGLGGLAMVRRRKS